MYLWILTTFLYLCGCSQSVEVSDTEKRDYYEEITQQDVQLAPTSFDMGIWVQKVYDFDPQSKTFSADGYAWLKWKGEIEAWDEVTSQQPAKTIEFLNAVSQWDLVLELSPEMPYQDSGGWNYQAMVFSGRFLANDLDLHRFPFEDITLPIEIETDDFWITDVMLTNDMSGSSGVSEKNTLQGYAYKGFKTSTRKHIYRTSMGLNADAEQYFGHPNMAKYPNFIAEITYERINLSSFWQLFVPLLAVMGITIITPLIDPRSSDTKIAIPASVILALVFLQDGYRQMLPDSLAYLTYMDQLYGIAYGISIVVFIEAIWFTNILSVTEDNVHEVVLNIKRLERWIHIGLLLTSVTLPVMIWYW